MEKDRENKNDLSVVSHIEKGLNNIYATLQQLDIKATALNTKYMFGVYCEIDRLVTMIQDIKEVGEDNVKQ